MHGSLKDILKLIASKGYSEVCIAGGTRLNSSFMEAGLVDEIFLDVEPIIFGTGIPLFVQSDFEYKLLLLGTMKLNKNTLQLHYKVLK